MNQVVEWFLCLCSQSCVNPVWLCGLGLRAFSAHEPNRIDNFGNTGLQAWLSHDFWLGIEVEYSSSFVNCFKMVLRNILSNILLYYILEKVAKAFLFFCFHSGHIAEWYRMGPVIPRSTVRAPLCAHIFPVIPVPVTLQINFLLFRDVWEIFRKCNSQWRNNWNVIFAMQRKPKVQCDNGVVKYRLIDSCSFSVFMSESKIILVFPGESQTIDTIFTSLQC